MTKNDRAYELSRAYPVSQDALFNSLIDADVLKCIWGLSGITVNARPNGQAQAKLTIDDESWDFVITYREVIPSEKLQWIVHFDRFPAKETRATLLFKQAPGGAEVTVAMSNFETMQERDANKAAWERALTKLAGLLGRS